MSFGDRLQALRRSNNMTQEEFAQQLKVSRQAVSKWESSRGYPEMEKIIYICNHYGVTMDELFLDEVPHSRPAESGQPGGEEHDLKSPTLKKAFGDFFANLSPINRLISGAAAAGIALLLLILLCASLTKGETNQMVMELIWLALLIVFVVGEAATVGLTSIWFAAGSLIALSCALLGGPEWLQIVLFIVISAGLLLAIRPVAQKYFNTKVQPTNVDRIIGETARVTQDIDNFQGQGAVIIGGMTWTARSSKDTVIPAGTTVRILRIEGVKVIVEEEKEEAVCQP